MQLVTILESDETAKAAYVQTNDSDVIGTDAPGGNQRFAFSDDPENDQPWKGTILDSLRAYYPGAEIHTVDSFNAELGDILVVKGLRMRLSDGSLVTPDEKVRLEVATLATAEVIAP